MPSLLMTDYFADVYLITHLDTVIAYDLDRYFCRWASCNWASYYSKVIYVCTWND